MEAPAGKLYVWLPLRPVSRHGVAGRAGSYKGTGWSVRLRSSRNSGFPDEACGLYITSLITTGPMTGPLLAAPGVAANIATKAPLPSDRRYRPNVASRSLA